MNPNDLIAQQQAAYNQMLQNAQQIAFGALVISIAGFILGAWVTYMFYARLRDIGQELMKFRIAYEFAHTPETRSRPRQAPRAESAWPEPPKPLVPAPAEQKYMPK